jgi:hypothetical protein
MSHRHRPSLLGALLWIGIGVLFLLNNFGRIHVWLLFKSYWPVLLILLGLGKVIDYFLKKDALSVRLGELFGIFMLILIGFAITGIQGTAIDRIVWNVPFQIGDIPIRPWQWFGEPHTFSEEARYALERSTTVRILNSYGSVSILPGLDQEIRIRLKKVIYGNESRAKSIADTIHLETATEISRKSSERLKPEAEPSKHGADCFVVRTNRDDLRSQGDRVQTDMEVFVPRNSQLQVRNEYGEVRVADINGKLDLGVTHGTLDAQDCTGAFVLSTRYTECRLKDLIGDVALDARGKVHLDGVKGDIRVTSENSPIEILNVDGSVSVTSRDGNIRIDGVSKSVEVRASGDTLAVRNLKGGLKITKHYGTASVADVDSDVKLESRSAALTLKNLRNVDIDSNSDTINADTIETFTLKGRTSRVRLNGVRSVDIQAALTNITVTNLAGDGTITDEYANISVSAQSLHKMLRIKNRNGGIKLFLPREASFDMNAAALNGKIQTNYPGLGPVRLESGTATLLSKVNGGGPAIVVENEYGNIRLAPGPHD